MQLEDAKKVINVGKVLVEAEVGRLQEDNSQSASERQREGAGELRGVEKLNR